MIDVQEFVIRTLIEEDNWMEEDAICNDIEERSKGEVNRTDVLYAIITLSTRGLLIQSDDGFMSATTDARKWLHFINTMRKGYKVYS